ncbi:MAG TPA: ethanolamine ammonia-lyase subunit EutB [Rubrivivax sp.]|nr:ethanolamine ammonia-lyase subunit EutB [Rubrivivax sp.]
MGTTIGSQPGLSGFVVDARTGRRIFVLGGLAGAALALVGCDRGKPQTAAAPVATPTSEAPAKVSIADVAPGEDVVAFVTRKRGKFDPDYYKAVIGSANEYKEGDESLGISADTPTTRTNARTLIANTRIGTLAERPMLDDAVYTLIVQTTDKAAFERVRGWKMSELKSFLLTQPEDQIKAVMVGLPSDIIGIAVKLMDNAELTQLGQTVFNPLPGSKVGAKGYMGARVQPNSPTDGPDDIVWQVFNSWSFGVGDVVLGNNPVSGETAKIAGIERALQDLLMTFKLEDTMPHCCLAHIDAQAKVEQEFPGSTALWFQSLGSTVASNAVFDVSVDKMLKHAATRTGRYGLYFETGQGADATNGNGAGFDMVIHESRKYGFARALKAKVAQARGGEPWVIVNDVAGFIGPEVFRTREQLVRCCLEDIAMGKLHGLPIGLDICSTLHMSVGLDDLDWCIDQIMPANPAYLMALPTKNDPMLSYLTTASQDHVRIRDKFGWRVNDPMWAFYQRLGVVNADGSPGPHFGDPKWVFLQYRRAKDDKRTDAQILAEADAKLATVRSHGVWIAEGHGAKPWSLEPKLDKYIRELVDDGKKMIYTVLPEDYPSKVAPALAIMTNSANRDDYILHPPSGEVINAASLSALKKLRDAHAGKFDVQIMVSDGLNGNAITDPGHVDVFLPKLRSALAQAGYKVAPETLVCKSGRVRAGYRAGEVLFGGLADKESRRAMLHLIGERPGSEHHSFSVYLSAPKVQTWAKSGKLDHDESKVVANIADTALAPDVAVAETLRVLKSLYG